MQAIPIDRRVILLYKLFPIHGPVLCHPKTNGLAVRLSKDFLSHLRGFCAITTSMSVLSIFRHAVTVDSGHAKETQPQSTGLVQEPSRIEIERLAEHQRIVSALLDFYPVTGTTQCAAKIAQKLEAMMEALEVRFGSLDEARGKTVLEFGCGARDNEATSGYGRLTCRFEPWFGRLMHGIGMDYVGIDRRTQTGEKFRSMQRDLTDPKTFEELRKMFPDASFDAVYMDGIGDRLFMLLADDKIKKHLVAEHSGFGNPFFEQLEEELVRLAKPGGRIPSIYTLGYRESAPPPRTFRPPFE
jgi:hypothetical protein